jgi:hypothetical protein
VADLAEHGAGLDDAGAGQQDDRVAGDDAVCGSQTM